MADAFDPLVPSPYKTLNVPKDATLAAIRTAHRKLVLITHPDKVQDEAEKKIKAEQFHQVQQAYEILSDENRRRRWDERALRLADMRTEIVEERAPLRRSQTSYAPPRPAHPPKFEMRGGRIVEERVPKNAGAYDDDMIHSPFSDAKATRKQDDRYDEPSPRKTSGRGYEEPRRRFAYVDEDFFDKKTKEKINKQSVKTARIEKEKQRDKAKRKDAEAKFSKKAAYVEDDMSDSDDYDRHYGSKSDSKHKSKDSDRRRARDEPPRKAEKPGARDNDDLLDRKIHEVHSYLSKSREPADSEPRRPARKRADSYRSQLPSPPPSPATPIERRSSGDDGRRSSARARGSRPPSPVRKSGKQKPKAEIVDPPPSRKPNLTTANSDKSALRTMFSSKGREPQRAATFTPETKPPKASSSKPTIRRSETVPIDHMKSSSDPRKSSSKLKNSRRPPSPDSTSSSSDTDSDSEDEIVVPPRKRSVQATPISSRHAYKVQGDDIRSPFVVAEPVDYFSRSRDTSPKGTPQRRSGERHRPSPVPRSATFDERPSPRHNYSRSESVRNIPPLKTSYSSREPSRLFGELSDEQSPKASYSSPKPYSDDRFRSPTTSRRASEDVDRDAYPGSLHKSHRRPHPSRNEVYV